ncbi:ParA family protein [Xylophilus sp.]|uniref:ParA family protein n=1 Tax=Xylophilus sp. TaxID=2653893 RepID=UPI0013BBA6D5|nr:ParA family protein [Xylophilus sp.]KAF1048512.1 MAG: hypothetical protein GAK38_01262 [Xylophilus sp.]
MPVVVVANPKGGVGKSTLATNIAGYYVSRGHPTVLGDLDRQQSSRLWLGLRPPAARPLGVWEASADIVTRPPAQATHAVLDTPAGFNGWRFKDVLRLADRVVVPLQPSVFDIFATKAFLDEVAAARRSDAVRIGLVGVRFDARTHAADQLRAFIDGLGVPVVGWLRPTQNYVHLAAQGLSVFDVSTSRVERDLEQWQDITPWLDGA